VGGCLNNQAFRKTNLLWKQAENFKIRKLSLRLMQVFQWDNSRELGSRHHRSWRKWKMIRTDCSVKSSPPPRIFLCRIRLLWTLAPMLILWS